jgi:hypothetical protein
MEKMISNRKVLKAVILLSLLSSCRVSTNMDKVDEGYYQSVKIKEGKTRIFQKRRVYVEDSLDIITITHGYKDTSSSTKRYSPNLGSSLYLTRREFDIDVFTIPFKIRMATNGFPPQLNSNFNAAVYLGQRYDFYKVAANKKIRNKTGRVNTTRGIGAGIFFGLGSATMNPFVTNNYINYEYDGLVFNAGLAAIYDAKVFNIGIAAGTDHLFDQNRKHWIYQNRIWIGVLFGMNLN